MIHLDTVIAAEADFDQVLRDKSNWKYEETNKSVEIYSYKGKAVSYPGEKIFIAQFNVPNRTLTEVYDALSDLGGKLKYDNQLKYATQLALETSTDGVVDSTNFVCYDHQYSVSGRAFLARTRSCITSESFKIVSRSVPKHSEFMTQQGASKEFVTLDNKLDVAALKKESFVLADSQLLATKGELVDGVVRVTVVNHADLKSNWLPGFITGTARKNSLLINAILCKKLDEGWVPNKIQ